MIPDLITVEGCSWELLPPGIYDSSLEEVHKRYVFNQRRSDLFEGLKQGLINLFNAGCPQVFLDGSYVTSKPLPNDYEVCWDTQFVDPNILDPVFLDFSDYRASQKEKYQGEYFPAMMIEGFTRRPFVGFFQNDKETGSRKGIIRISNYILGGNT